MASSSKPTAVHFTLVFFILVSAILGLLFWVDHKALDEKIDALAKAKSEASTATSASTKALEQIDALKKLIGHEFEKVGEADPDNPNTVLGAGKADITTYGAGVAQDNYSTALQKVDEARKTALTERDDLRTKLDTEHASYLALEAKWNAQLDEQKKARTSTEQDLAGLTTKKEEELAAKEKDINDLKKAIADAQTELEQEREANAKYKKEKEQAIVNLMITNQKVIDELKEMKKTTFEVPDGVIEWVNHESKLVWINLGQIDNLKTRITFSVYNRGNTGVARDARDVKGSIEVTQILGPHRAQARILKEDIYSPMAAGDQIYTPLWSPGGTDKFSFIGQIDLDGDKQSDREELHEMVATAGAAVDNEVDDEGVLHVNGKVVDADGLRINEETKFLVIGHLPELEEVGDETAKATLIKIYDYRKKMEDLARQHGVTIIKLTDFLNYIGYVPERRLFKPGGTVPYQLKAGARSASVDESAGSRTSSGQTSGLYSGDRNLKAQRSTGTTSKLFRGGK